MKSEAYPITHDEDRCYFEFVSKSKKKTITKVVMYSPLYTGSKEYNLFLGDVESDGELSDIAVSDNADLSKVIATVIRTIFIFLQMYPNCSVYFTGSTPERTRLYRAIIGREISNAEKFFKIYGTIGFSRYRFKPNVAYEGYLITLNKKP